MRLILGNIVLVAEWTERNKVGTKTKGQWLFIEFSGFQNKTWTAYVCFHGNGPYGKIPTKIQEPITMLRFTLTLSYHSL